MLYICGVLCNARQSDGWFRGEVFARQGMKKESCVNHEQTCYCKYPFRRSETRAAQISHCSVRNEKGGQHGTSQETCQPSQWSCLHD